jgi:hypothetical protein
MNTVKIDIEQIEVARDAWQEDEGETDHWREMLKEHPTPIQNYIGKRFEAERAELARVVERFAKRGEEVPGHWRPRFRITQITYAQSAPEQWAVTDNTPAGND